MNASSIQHLQTESSTGGVLIVEPDGAVGALGRGDKDRG